MHAPVWHQDILLAVQKRPRRLISLLACEAAVINTLIDWGTIRTASAERRFAKTLATAQREPMNRPIRLNSELECCRRRNEPYWSRLTRPNSPDDILD